MFHVCESMTHSPHICWNFAPHCAYICYKSSYGPDDHVKPMVNEVWTDPGNLHLNTQLYTKMFRTISALCEMVFALVAQMTQLRQRCEKLVPIKNLIDFCYFILVSGKNLLYKKYCIKYCDSVVFYQNV